MSRSSAFARWATPPARGPGRCSLDPESRFAAQAIARRVEYVELAAHPAFHRRFVTAMGFDGV